MRTEVEIVVSGVVVESAISSLAPTARSQSQNRPLAEARSPSSPGLRQLNRELLQLCLAGCFFWGARG